MIHPATESSAIGRVVVNFTCAVVLPSIPVHVLLPGKRVIKVDAKRVPDAPDDAGAYTAQLPPDAIDVWVEYTIGNVPVVLSLPRSEWRVVP